MLGPKFHKSNKFQSLEVVCRKSDTQLSTLVVLNCFNCIFRHLKLELLKQFPASDDKKYHYLWKIDMSNIKLFDQLSIYQKLFYQIR